MIADAIAWKGFSYVEILQNCHVFWGKRNGMPQAMDMLKFFKDNSVRNTDTPEEDWFDIPVYAENEKKIKFVLGVLHNEQRPEYGEQYAKLRSAAMAAAMAGAA
jgi:2-oxoglutarate ferredoxin oxidoreductase subunit beta